MDLAGNVFKSHYYLIINMNAFSMPDPSIIDILRRKGYKVTPQRIAICRSALLSRDHPSAMRIYRQVKKLHPTVSVATVYKTLHILREQGMIQELAFPEGEARFDPNMKLHLNLVCHRCGKVTDIEHHIAREMIVKVSEMAKFTVTGQRLELNGICSSCAGRTRTEKSRTTNSPKPHYSTMKTILAE